MMGNMRARHALAFVCLLIFTTLQAVAADRGMIPPEGVSVYGPGQKAIIAWNGEREVLILSTDVWASENAWVLELLPLPSEPAKPEAGSFESFEKLQELLREYASTLRTKWRVMPAEAPELEIIFQENIGAHSITIVRTTSAVELMSFAVDLWMAQGFTQELSWGRLEDLAASYIYRGLKHWVLDLVNLSDRWESVQPIVYTFESDSLYFPLEISSLAQGETKITLFTLTDGKLDASSVRASGFNTASLSVGKHEELIEFEVSQKELQRISPKVAELFEDGAWLTALTYSGSLENLKGDLMLFAAAPPPSEADRLYTIAWAGRSWACCWRYSPSSIKLVRITKRVLCDNRWSN